MNNRICPVCSSPITDDLPGGLCPACLLAESNRSRTPDSVAETAQLGDRLEPPSPAQLVEIFPEFEILDMVGCGGMGAVYKVRQKNLDRIVALKVFLLRDREGRFSDRFVREARALARLNHPNIVTVHDFGQRGELNYLVMEFIDGTNLRQLAATKSVEAADALRLVPQLCDALQYAHDNDVVHRDIKPENVLIDRSGTIKIADFGLAKLTDQNDANLTHSQQVMGTLNYMAPEQRERPTEVDHRADIYSLGVVIYELLTGELPLGRFSPPSEKAKVDNRLDDVVMRALEKEPARRYQQASEFKTGVESFSKLPQKSNSAQAGDSQIGTGEDTFAVKSSRTAIDISIFFVAMLCGCAAGLVFAIKHQDVLPLSDDAIDLLGLLLAMTSGFFFAISGYVRSFADPKLPKRKRVTSIFGILAMFLGFVGASSFIVGSKFGGMRDMWNAIGLAFCIFSGFVYMMSGVISSKLNDLDNN